MSAPTIGTPGTPQAGTGTAATPGAPASVTAGTMVLGLMGVAGVADPPTPSDFFQALVTSGVNPGAEVVWRRNTGGAEPSYSWPTDANLGQHYAIAFPVESEENDSDPFHTSKDVKTTASIASSYLATSIASVPAGSTLVWVGVAAADRSVNTAPVVNGTTPMTRMTAASAQLLHAFKIENFAGGNVSVAAVASTGGTTRLTAMLFAIKPAIDPAQGAAAGTFGWDGAAVGVTPEVTTPAGSAEGTFGWDGAAEGHTVPKGSAGGTFGWAGAAQGPVSYTEHIEDWADLDGVNDSGVTVSGNRLYSGGPSGARGFTLALPFPTEGIWRYQQLVYNVDAGLQNPTIKLGVSCGDPATGIADSDTNAVGIQMQFATRARSSFKGSALSAVTIQDEQIVGTGPSVDATLLFDVTADENFISFSLKDVAAVREMIAFRISRAELAAAGKTVNKVYVYFLDARTTSGSSLSPFIFQTGSIGPSHTTTVAGQQIEGAGQRIITTKPADESPFEWWAATPPDMTDDTPIVIHCPQSLTGDGHDAWTDTRMEPITTAAMDGYIWLSSTDTVDRFGNQIELDNYEALLDWCEFHFGGGRDIFLFGTSMGTMVCVNLIGRGVIPARAMAVIGFAGGFDWLWNNVTEKRDDIRNAYGVASDGSDLRAKTTGYDPLLDFIDSPNFEDVGFRFFTGSSDAITPTELSEDMAAIALDAGASEAVVIEGSGGHLDGSQYHGDQVVALYQRNVSPSTGTASGTFGWAGSATGSAPANGEAAGTFGWDGAAAGRAPHEGAAAGTYGWDGAAAGHAEPQGTAAGSYGWDGEADGHAGARGIAAGTFGWASGDATGHATPKGGAAGSYGWDGAAEGYSMPKGSAAGSFGWAGSARAGGSAVGSAAGEFGWDGAAAGGATPKGTGAGSFGWSGTAEGHAEPHGSAAGAYGWDGDAEGHAAARGAAEGSFGWDGAITSGGSAVGAAEGSFGWDGVAAGHAIPKADATGEFGWDGTATGKVPAPQGAAAGEFGWTGEATGHAGHQGAAAGVYGWTGHARGRSTAGIATHVVTVTDRSRITTVRDRSRTTTVREPG